MIELEILGEFESGIIISIFIPSDEEEGMYENLVWVKNNDIIITLDEDIPKKYKLRFENLIYTYVLNRRDMIFEAIMTA